jgi:hypothetical protein
MTMLSQDQQARAEYLEFVQTLQTQGRDSAVNRARFLNNRRRDEVATAAMLAENAASTLARSKELDAMNAAAPSSFASRVAGAVDDLDAHAELALESGALLPSGLLKGDAGARLSQTVLARLDAIDARLDRMASDWSAESARLANLREALFQAGVTGSIE